MKEKIKIICGILLVIIVILMFAFLIIFVNGKINNLFSDGNIRCLDYCFNGVNFSEQWRCLCGNIYK